MKQKNLLEQARITLLQDNLIYGALSMKLEIVEDPKCKTAWTDGKKIGFNPSFVGSLDSESRVGLLAHEVAHCALLHFGRRNGRDIRHWNHATDRKINSLLVKQGFKLPDGALYEKHGQGLLSAEQICDLEQQEADQKKQQQQQQGGNDKGQNGDQSQDGNQQGKSEDSKSGDGKQKGKDGEGKSKNDDKDADSDKDGEENASSNGGDQDGEEQDGNGQGDSEQDGKDGEGEGSGKGEGKSDKQGGSSKGSGKGLGDDGEDEDGEQDAEGQDGDTSDEGDKYADEDTFGECRDGALDEAEATTLENDWKIAIATAMKQFPTCGKGFGNLITSALESDRKTQLRWEDILADFLTASAKDDYNWMRPSRRSSDDYLTPSLHNPAIKNFVICIDTSGSVNDRQLAAFNEEINVILSHASCTLTVIHVDTQVRAVEEYSAQDAPINLEAKGRGGTTLGAALRYIEKEGIECDGIVFFTDLCNYDWGTDPCVPVLWLLSNPYKWNHIPPPFGEVVPMDDKY